MFGISDLFQWERFVTPTVIKVFYWLAVVIFLLLGLAGAVSSLRTMAFNPFVGIIFLITSLLGGFMGVILARIIAELVLIVFRINEHLGAIRSRGSGNIGAIRSAILRRSHRDIYWIAKSQVAKRKCMTSPSCHDVVLALEPHLPASRAPASPPQPHSRHRRLSRRE